MKKLKNIILKEYEVSEDIFNEKYFLEIEKFNKISGTKIFERVGKSKIKAKQFVGIIKINDKNITILPKIFWEENSKIIKNLLFMLSYTKKIKIKESDIANLDKIDNLFEVFIYIFAKELIELLKKDFKKNYNNIEENSNFLKWKLNFAKHIKNNLFNKSKFFIEYEKMDENILLNIFFKSCTQKLLKISNSRLNYKLLKKIDFILQDIEFRIFQKSSSLNKLKFNKQNKSYKWVFSLAKLLYFWNSPDFSNNQFENFSILFDMNILFEEFLAEFVKKNIFKLNLKSVKTQVWNKYVFENNKFNLRPDILLQNNFDEKIIIDTKYKKLDKNNYNYWVWNSDIYQMFMYWMRYFEKCETKKIILLYPKYFEKIWNYYISEEKIEIFIKTINLNFDLVSDSWKEELLGEIKEILKLKN